MRISTITAVLALLASPALATPLKCKPKPNNDKPTPSPPEDNKPPADWKAQPLGDAEQHPVDETDGGFIKDAGGKCLTSPDNWMPGTGLISRECSGGTLGFWNIFTKDGKSRIVSNNVYVCIDAGDAPAEGTSLSFENVSTSHTHASITTEPPAPLTGSARKSATPRSCGRWTTGLSSSRVQTSASTSVSAEARPR